MLDFIVCPSDACIASGAYPVRASIPDARCHAFFVRYFRDAQLDRANCNFLGFWGATSLSGYQLVRLQQVLDDALLDLSARPEQFRILVGWVGQPCGAGSEQWANVNRNDLIEIARALSAAITLARETTGHIFAVGD